jgi:hypothetical protein
VPIDFQAVEVPFEEVGSQPGPRRTIGKSFEEVILDQEVRGQKNKSVQHNVINVVMPPSQ